MFLNKFIGIDDSKGMLDVIEVFLAWCLFLALLGVVYCIECIVMRWRDDDPE